MRAFAPWKLVTGGWHVDDRGFSLETGNPKITSRISCEVTLNPKERVVLKPKVWSDISVGPDLRPKAWFQPGGILNPFPVPTPTGVARAQPEAQLSNLGGKHCCFKVAISGGNPLFPGSPGIDVTTWFHVWRSEQDGEKLLRIDTRIQGDQFPAFEVFADDGCQNKVFLGGFAPPSKKDIALLFGTENRGCWFGASQVGIWLDNSALFKGVSGTHYSTMAYGDTHRYKEELKLKTKWSMPAWNAGFISSIPLPSDQGT